MHASAARRWATDADAEKRPQLAERRVGPWSVLPPWRQQRKCECRATGRDPLALTRHSDSSRQTVSQLRRRTMEIQAKTFWGGGGGRCTHTGRGRISDRRQTRAMTKATRVQHQDTSGATAEAAGRVRRMGGGARDPNSFAETAVFVQSAEKSCRAPSR